MRIKQKIKAKIMGGVSIALAFMIGIGPVGVSAKTSGEEVIDIPVEVLEQLGITPAVTDTGRPDDTSEDATEDGTVIDTGDTAVETVGDNPADEIRDAITEETEDIGDITEDLQDITFEDILAGISDYIPDDELGAEIGNLSELLSDPMAQMFLEMMLISLMKTPVEVEQMPLTDGPLTPDGNMDLIDDYGNTEKAGKQFITVTTKNGNYFYIIIDRDDEGTETVHFLNMVDEADLLSLMDEDAVDNYIALRGIKDAADADQKESDTKDPTETPDKTPGSDDKDAAKDDGSSDKTGDETGKDTDASKDKKKSSSAGLIFVLVLTLGGGGAYLYFKKFRKKRPQTAAEDPDAYYDEDADDPLANLSDEVNEIMNEDGSQDPGYGSDEDQDDETDNDPNHGDDAGNNTETPDTPTTIDFDSETGDDENDEEEN